MNNYANIYLKSKIQNWWSKVFEKSYFKIVNSKLVLSKFESQKKE